MWDALRKLREPLGWAKAGALAAVVALAVTGLIAVGGLPGVLRDVVRIVADTATGLIDLFAGGFSPAIVRPLADFIGSFVIALPAARAAIPYIWPDRPAILIEDFDLADPDAAYLYDPRRNDVPLLEREDETAHLYAFLRPVPAKPRFMHIEGTHGIGKTRLALSWLRDARHEGWDAGLLSPDATPDAIARTKFRRDTAIVFDEAATTQGAQALLDALLAAKGRLRILLVSQTALEITTGLDLAADKRRAEAFRPGLTLDPLSDVAMRALNAELGDGAIAQAEGRPLYALLGPDPDAAIARRVTEFTGRCTDSKDEELLALSALAHGSLAPEVREITGLDMSRRRVARLWSDARLGAGRAAGRLPKLSPEPLADAIWRDWAADHPDAWRRLMEQAVKINRAAVLERLGSLAIGSEGKPWRDQVLEMLEWFEDLEGDFVKALEARAEERAGAMDDVVNAAIEAEQAIGFDEHQAMARVRNTMRDEVLAEALLLRRWARSWPGSIVLQSAAAYQVGKAFSWSLERPELDFWLTRLTALCEDAEGNIAPDLEFRFLHAVSSWMNEAYTVLRNRDLCEAASVEALYVVEVFNSFADRLGNEVSLTIYDKLLETLKSTMSALSHLMPKRLEMVEDIAELILGKLAKIPEGSTYDPMQLRAETVHSAIQAARNAKEIDRVKHWLENARDLFEMPSHEMDRKLRSSTCGTLGDALIAHFENPKERDQVDPALQDKFFELAMYEPIAVHRLQNIFIVSGVAANEGANREPKNWDLVDFWLDAADKAMALDEARSDPLSQVYFARTLNAAVTGLDTLGESAIPRANRIGESAIALCTHPVWGHSVLVAEKCSHIFANLVNVVGQSPNYSDWRKALINLRARFPDSYEISDSARVANIGDHEA